MFQAMRIDVFRAGQSDVYGCVPQGCELRSLIGHEPWQHVERRLVERHNTLVHGAHPDDLLEAVSNSSYYLWRPALAWCRGMAKMTCLSL